MMSGRVGRKVRFDRDDYGVEDLLQLEQMTWAEPGSWRR